MTAARVVLLEILNTDRYRNYRSQHYPFVKAWLSGEGISTAWLCVGVIAREALSGRPLYIYDLPSVDRRRLSAALIAHGATHVVLNERLADDLWQALRAAHPTVRFTMLTSADSNRLACDLGRRLDLDIEALQTAGRLLEDTVTPDFARTALNPLAAEIKPFVHLMVGPECVYRRPIAQNEHFDGLDLTGCIRDRGCSFCFNPDVSDHKFLTPVVDLALRQIRAAEKTAGPDFFAHEYQVHGVNLWHQVDAFARALCGQRISPSSFHFASRIDEFLNVQPRLQSVLPELAAAGHRICLYNIGIENFSPAENERFHKGLTPEQIDAGIRRIFDLEQRFPQTFVFSAMGGFGVILFTPWTNIADLRLNVQAFARYGIDMFGFVADSALQLLPDLAITRLAQRDGFLAETFSDFCYDSGCITEWNQHELPWRFANPEVAVIYAIGRRLSRDADIAPAEPRYALVQRWFNGLPTAVRDPLNVFRTLLDVMTEKPELRRWPSILQAIERSLAVRSSFDLSSVDESQLDRPFEPMDLQPEDLPEYWTRLAEQVAAVYARNTKARRYLFDHRLEAVRLRRFADHFGLEAELSAADRTLRIFVEPRKSGGRSFLQTVRFQLSYHLSAGVLGADQQTLLHCFLKVVEHTADPA